MSRHSTAHHFLQGLVDLGVEYIFANLGTDHVSLIEEMARWDKEGRKHPDVILCPHEVVAVHMAGGYARAAYAAWRTERLARHVCAFRAGPLRYRQHRPPLREVGIFAALRHRGEIG